MSAHAFIVKTHRIAAILILLAIPPAAWASIKGGGEPAIFVYLPLAPLFVLLLTGTWQLVAPWVRRARRSA